MPRFRYRAFKQSGESVVGELEFDSPQSVIADLHRQGLLPVAVDPVASRPWLQRLTRDFQLRHRPGSREVALFTQQLASLVDAGLPMDRALGIIAETSSRSPLARTAMLLRDRVREGRSLADAMDASGVFDRPAVSMVRAGQSSGALGAVLARLAAMQARGIALREEIRSALVYPVILLVMATLAILFVLLVVVPEFKPLLSDAGVSLPLMTRIVFAAGEILAAGWPFMVAGIVVVLLAINRMMLRADFRRLAHAALLRLPRLGDLIRGADAARFCRNLGTLLSGGVSAPEALRIATDTLANIAVADGIRAVSPQLNEGRSLALVLDRARVLPDVATQLVRVGEETGKLEPMLLRAADLFDEDVRRGVTRLVALLTPVLTIGLGAVVAMVVASLFGVLLSFNLLAG